MSRYLDSIECSDQPLDISFHPKNDNLLAVALVDGTLEVHDIYKQEEESNEDDSEDEPDSILSSIPLHNQVLPQAQQQEQKPGLAAATAAATTTTKTTTANRKKASCRSTTFSSDGFRIYTGGTLGDICALDAERACTFSATSPLTKPLWRIDDASDSPMQVLHAFSKQCNLFATGDDIGGVRVWDDRICGNEQKSYHDSQASRLPRGCVMSWRKHSDYISGIDLSDDETTLLTSCADSRLGVFDLRKIDNDKNDNDKQQQNRLSDDQEDELLSVKIIKHGKKVICGSQQGVLNVFSWGTWGDISDRFPGHPSSIDALLKVDEDTLLTGSSDGHIRVVSIHPDRLIGVLSGNNNHEGFPIETLQFNSNRHVVASVSHDRYVRLWDAKILDDQYDDDDDDNDDDYDDDRKGTNKGKLTCTKQNVVAVGKTKRSSTGNESDDDWGDSDNKSSDSDNDDDNDSDDDSDEPETANQKRAKRFKTENEKFFEDL